MTAETVERVDLRSIREAAAGLADVAPPTALREMPALSQQAGVPVYLKLESQQATGAFKLRGAWTAVRRLPPETRARGVITYSSGNHGQALAWAAHRQGMRAVIVMPSNAPPAKIDGVRRWQGEVVLCGTTSEERYTRAMEIAAADGLAVVAPFDNLDVIAGQATVALEILDQAPGVTDVAVPVGGGGLAAGVTTALAALRPDVRVWTVEPEGSACYAAAVAAGRPVRLERTGSVADGLLPLTVGSMTFAHLHGRAVPLTVPDTAIVEATRWLHGEGVLAEPSGAATTAALRSGALRPAGPTVLVVSGGNMDPAALATLRPVRP